MTQDHVFYAANAVVLPCWLLLIAAPRWRYTERIVHAAWVPALVALAYLWALGNDSEPPPGAGFHSLTAVTALLSTSHASLVVWLHFMIVDLVAGALIARDARKHGIGHGWVAPILLATAALAPLGLLAYGILRFAKTKSVALSA